MPRHWRETHAYLTGQAHARAGKGDAVNEAARRYESPELRAAFMDGWTAG